MIPPARSDSPATRKRGLVSVDYSSQSRAREPEDGNSSLVSVNDFNLIRVIGRGSYAKVMLVSRYFKNLVMSNISTQRPLLWNVS